MASTQLRLHEDTPCLELKCKGDKFLMAEFITHVFQGPALQQLNYCRLFLQVYTLSDITTASGTHISYLSWHGHRDEQRASSLQWPLQPRPSSWKLWQSALMKVLQVSHYTHSLSTPLGPWLCKSHHHWFYSTSEHRLYCQRRSSYDWFSQCPSSAHTRHAYSRFHQKAGGCTTEPPTDLLPASVYSQPPCWILSGVGRLLVQSPSPPPSFHSFTLSPPPALAWAWEHLAIINCDQVLQAITNGTCFGVSDGSFKAQFGTAAWTLTTPDDHGNISGCCTVPGSPDVQSSYRSELAGLYAMVHIVATLCSYHHLSTGSVTLYCDGKGPIHRVSHSSWTTWATEDHFDLIASISKTVASLPIKLIFQHVRGHQDSSGNNLDIYAAWNCEMDRRAKDHWDLRHTHSQPMSNCVLGEPWSIWHFNEKICHSLVDRLYKIAQAPRCEAYWAKKMLATPVLEEISWSALEHARQSTPLPLQHFAVKYSTGFLGVGKMMVNMKQWDQNQCPLCLQPEDALHVVCCRHPMAETTWSQSLQTLSSHLQSIHTEPTLIHAIIAGLTAWRTQSDLPSTVPPLLSKAINSQHQIGWQAFLLGFISYQWANAQQESCPNSSFSPNLWTSKLIRWTWQIPWAMWQNRNSILHDLQSHHPVDTTVNHAIEVELKLGETGLDPLTRAMFCKHYSSILNAPLPIRQAWLRSISLSRDYSTDIK
jgi:hypothetical protein